MSTKKTIAKSFTVSTIEDGVSVQAQYAPNANPTSGQIHTVWQEGDLYMRTRESDDAAWSSWHKIVGESGDETDFSFGISQYKTTANASTAPSDISSWSDAPLAVTTAKPYLWSKVQQKSWNESTQQYVVDSTRYIRLTGEEGVVYDIQTPVDSIHIGENQTSATLSGTAKFYKKEGTKDKVQTVFYYGIYKRTGTTFEKVATGNANSYTFNALSVANTVNAIVIYLFASSYTETSPETQTYLVKREMMVVDAGNSPYFADLDNEMDAIQCKHDGSVISDQTVSTVISMWKGSSVEAFVIDNIYRNGTKLTWDGNNNGVLPRVSGSTVSLEFTTSASISDIDDFKITIHSYNDNTVTRELHFTINGVRANAIYRLVPSHSQIVKKKDGSYVPSGNVTCSVEKTENGSTSTPSSSEYTLEKSVNGGSYTTYSATAASSITSDLKFRLTVGGVVVDLETVPLVSDGDKGEGGVSYSIVFTKAAARVDESNQVTAELAGYAYKNVGGVRSALKNTTIRYGYILTDSDTYADTTTDNSGFFDAGTWFNGDDITGYGKNSPSIFAAIIIGGTVVHAEMINISIKGSTGNRGKIGRFFYYAGEFDSSNTTQTFVVNDAQAPYFSHGVNASTGLMNCHVYNPTENGTFTMAQMWANSSQSWNNAPWEVMTNDFKYLITQAIFGQYAHFGSFIINGDWLISQYGTINGVESLEYIKFDPEYPYTSVNTQHTVNGTTWTGYNFVPNFAINGLTGQGIFGGGKIIFNANGGGQLANGKIVWNENGVGNLAGGNVSWDANGNLTIVGDITANNGTFNGVIKTPYREESTWYTTLKKGGCIRIGNASQGLSLPSWNSLEGVELDIMNNTYQTTYVGTSLTDENGNGIGIVLRHYKLATVRLQAGSRCKLKAIPYTKDGVNYVVWLILNEGNFDIYSLKDYNNETYYVARDKSITPIPV